MSDTKESLSIREKIVIKLIMYIVRMLDVEKWSSEDWNKDFWKDLKDDLK